MRKIIISLLIMGVALVAASAAFASEAPKKVFVCKYVGTPGVDERLQTGQNPINVSVNAIPGGASVGAFFADAQGRSFVLAFDTGQDEPSVSACPTPEGPPNPPDNPPVNPPVTPPTHDCVYTGAGKDGNLDANGGSNDDCAPLPGRTSVPPALTPVEKIVYVDRVVYQDRVVFKTKIKTVFKTKVKTIVKWKTKTKVVLKVVRPEAPKRKVCPVGTKLYHGACAVMGSG